MFIDVVWSKPKVQNPNKYSYLPYILFFYCQTAKYLAKTKAWILSFIRKLRELKRSKLFRTSHRQRFLCSTDVVYFPQGARGSHGKPGKPGPPGLPVSWFSFEGPCQVSIYFSKGERPFATYMKNWNIDRSSILFNSTASDTQVSYHRCHEAIVFVVWLLAFIANQTDENYRKTWRREDINGMRSISLLYL